MNEFLVLYNNYFVPSVKLAFPISLLILLLAWYRLKAEKLKTSLWMGAVGIAVVLAFDLLGLLRILGVSSYNLMFLISTVLNPIIALLFPFLLVYVFLKSNKSNLNVTKAQLKRFALITFLIAPTLFILLVFLTGGITFYSQGSLNVGLYISFLGIIWNPTPFLSIIFPYEITANFIAISILSALFYAAIFTFPATCAVTTPTDPCNCQQEETKHPTVEKDYNLEANQLTPNPTSATVSTVPSVTASLSAITSGVICCPTGIIALIAPVFSNLLSPFSPILQLFSLLILEYAFYKLTLPRIPFKVAN